jgi:hypothetical protein
LFTLFACKLAFRFFVKTCQTSLFFAISLHLILQLFACFPFKRKPGGHPSYSLFARAGHLLLFTPFANCYSATSMYHFAIATPLLFWILQYAICYLLFAICYSLLPLTSLMGFIVVNFLNFN